MLLCASGLKRWIIEKRGRLAIYANDAKRCVHRIAITVGSLREKVMMESLTAFIGEIVCSENPKAMFEEYTDKISELFELRSSIKHMRNVDMSFCSQQEAVL